MIGQAIARPANFINQELYGPPTSLPWGISIDAFYRIGEFRDLAKYPARNDPLSPDFCLRNDLEFYLPAEPCSGPQRRWPEKFKPGAVLAWWLILAGSGRVFIEFFRPDQPIIAGTFLTTSQLVSALMGLAGLILLMARNGTFNIPGLKFPDAYKIAPAPAPAAKPAKKAGRKRRLN
jgi:phosphatidylglycerol---prolipoprotein diacylglyceryl transferase